MRITVKARASQPAQELEVEEVSAPQMRVRVLRWVTLLVPGIGFSLRRYEWTRADMALECEVGYQVSEMRGGMLERGRDIGKGRCGREEVGSGSGKAVRYWVSGNGREMAGRSSGSGRVGEAGVTKGRGNGIEMEMA